MTSASHGHASACHATEMSRHTVTAVTKVTPRDCFLAYIVTVSCLFSVPENLVKLSSICL